MQCSFEVRDAPGWSGEKAGKMFKYEDAYNFHLIQYHIYQS